MNSLHRIAFLLGLVLSPVLLRAVVILDPLTIADGPTENSFTLSWHGRAGQTYFLLMSTDLVNWTSLPLIEVGNDENIEYIFPLPNDFVKAFWRLVVTDQTASDPQAADFDGDGIPTSWELEHGLNPLLADDAMGDPDLDDLTNLAEFRLGLHPRQPATVRSAATLGFRLFSP